MTHARCILHPTITLSFAILTACSQFQLQPSTQVTATGGASIHEAQQEAHDGPKARIAVARFTDKTAKGGVAAGIGSGMADMLATALFNTNRYIVLERETLSDILAEQDIGTSGRVRAETAAPVGQIEGAELLVTGVITEFEPGAAGANANGGVSAGASTGASIGALGGPVGMIIGGIVGGVAGSFQKAHLAIDLRVIDTKTSRIVAATSVQGEATDIAGMGSLVGANLSGALSGYAKTPMEKAIRIALQEGVKFIASKTPAKYYRHPPLEKAASPGVSATSIEGTNGKASIQDGATTPAVHSPPVSVPAPAPLPNGSEAVILPATATPSEIVYVNGDSVNLRSGPGTTHKRIGSVTRGAKLTVLETKGEWLCVRQADGREGWIAKRFTKNES